MKLCLKALVEFYDQRNEGNWYCTSPINAMLGEELALALLSDYIRTQKGGSFEITQPKCTQGFKRGKWLDAWLRFSPKTSETPSLFQTEIKNWNANSVNGAKLSIDADEETLKDFRIKRWAKRFEQISKDEKQPAYVPKEFGTRKVLLKMKLPKGVDENERSKVRPLLIFWEAMHPKGKADPLFWVPTGGDANINQIGASKLWVFSISQHVRNYLARAYGRRKTTLFIDSNIMPLSNRRLEWIDKILVR